MDSESMEVSTTENEVPPPENPSENNEKKIDSRSTFSEHKYDLWIYESISDALEDSLRMQIRNLPKYVKFQQLKKILQKFELSLFFCVNFNDT